MNATRDGGFTAAVQHGVIAHSENSGESIDQTVGEDSTSAELPRYLLTALATSDAAQAPADYAAGVEAVAKMLDKKAADYAREFGLGHNGSLSFGQGAHADAKRDYHWSLIELAEEVRAMNRAAPVASAAKSRQNDELFAGLSCNAGVTK